MIFSTLFLASLGSAMVIPTNILQRDTQVPGTFHVGFSGVRRSEDPTTPLCGRRRGPVDHPVYLETPFYMFDFEVGTPPQKLQGVFDTGTADVWMHGSDNPDCAAGRCKTRGLFDSAASSTYRQNNSDFFVSYGPIGYQEGDWATDTLGLGGGLTLENYSVGVGRRGNASYAVFGVGYAALEGSQLYSGVSYRNFPLTLVDRGLTKAPAYSVWLNSRSAGAGGILFGGVDHGKYEGTLARVPVLKDSDGLYTTFTVVLHQVTVWAADGCGADVADVPLGATIDSATSSSVLPRALAQRIFGQLNATYSETYQGYVQACDLPGSISFNFSGAVINAPLSSFLTPQTVPGSPATPATLPDGRALCLVDVFMTDSPTAIFGPHFLNNAYVVHDLANHELALAQARSPSDAAAAAPTVEVIESTAPSATKAPLYSATTGVPPPGGFLSMTRFTVSSTATP